MSFASKPNTFEQQQEACGLILHSIRFAVQVENSAHKPSHAHGISVHTSKQNPWFKLISSWCPRVPSATSKDCLAVYTRMTIVASDFLMYLCIRPDASLHDTYTEQRSIMQTTCQIIYKTQHHGDCQFLPQQRVASLFRHLASSTSMPLRGFTLRSHQAQLLLQAHHRWPSARRAYLWRAPVPCIVQPIHPTATTHPATQAWLLAEHIRRPADHALSF